MANTSNLTKQSSRADGTRNTDARLFNVRLTVAEFALLDAECTRQGRTRSDVVRDFIKNLTPQA